MIPIVVTFVSQRTRIHRRWERHPERIWANTGWTTEPDRNAGVVPRLARRSAQFVGPGFPVGFAPGQSRPSPRARVLPLSPTKFQKRKTNVCAVVFVVPT